MAFVFRSLSPRLYERALIRATVVEKYQLWKFHGETSNHEFLRRSSRRSILVMPLKTAGVRLRPGDGAREIHT